MPNLPKGWTKTSLKNIISDCQAGFACGNKDVEDGLKHLRMNNIDVNGNINLDIIRKVPRELAKERYLLLQGDILLCTTNSQKLVGKSAVFDINSEFTFSNHLTRVRVNEKVANPKWVQLNLWYLWKSGAFENSCKHWVNQSTLPKEELLKIEIILPPLSVQNLILNKVMELYRILKDCKTRLNKIPHLLKHFNQSVLSSACLGRLTAEWRAVHPNIEKPENRLKSVCEKKVVLYKENCNKMITQKRIVQPGCLEEHRFAMPRWAMNIPTSWCIVALGQVIDSGPQNGLYKSQSFYGQGTIIVRIEDFYEGTIHHWNTLKRLIITAEELKLYGLKNKDILINRVNSIKYLGKSALVRNLNVPAVFESNMMRLSLLRDCVDSEYLVIYLQSFQGLEELRKNAKHAVNQSSINQKDVKSCAVALPPLDEQNEIVKIVKSLMKVSEAIADRHQKLDAYLSRLTVSILTMAFAGKL